MKLLAKGLEQICADKTAGYFIRGESLIPRLTEITGLLERYLDEIERFNPIYGLVKAADREELIVKHILDSLAPLGHIVMLMGGEDVLLEKEIADLGSGAGLPGIPLAICLPEIHFTLIERMARRAGFLQSTLAALGITNATVEEIELEKTRPARFDLLVLRALSPLTPVFAAKLIRLLKPPQQPVNGMPVPGGVIAAYKGRHETAKSELDSLSNFTTELIPLSVPFLDEQRCLAVIRDAVSLNNTVLV